MMPKTMDRYEVNEPGFTSVEPVTHRTVWDWLNMAVLRDAAGEIMMYPENTVYDVVSQMNEWARKHHTGV